MNKHYGFVCMCRDKHRKTLGAAVVIKCRYSRNPLWT